MQVNIVQILVYICAILLIIIQDKIIIIFGTFLKNRQGLIPADSFILFIILLYYYLNILLFYKHLPVTSAEVPDAETISTLEIGYSGHSVATCNTVSNATVVS